MKRLKRSKQKRQPSIAPRLKAAEKAITLASEALQAFRSTAAAAKKEALAKYLNTRLQSWRTAPKISCHTWAEENRIIASGPVPGRWRSRPYQKPVLESVTEPGVEGTVYIAASQGGGKTEICLNVAGHHMDVDPSAILLVEPTLDMADAFSKDRLATMIAATPSLKDKVRDPRARDSGNTTRHKLFPNGHITMVGANSASGLAMRPIRVVIFDEVDRYGLSAGTEGDPVRLAETRTFAYEVLGLSRKLYVTSPGKKYGRSFKLWKKTDQQQYMVPCPDCGKRQVLKWAQVHWEKDKDGEHLPETAIYSCEKCGSCWDDPTRWKAVRDAPAASKDGNPYEATAPFKGWHGFRLPGLCVLGSKLGSFVKQWIDAQGNPELLRVFVNTVLCEWEDITGDSVSELGIMRRRKDYNALIPKGTQLPLGVAVLTMGVDIQKDRIEYEIIGWGRAEESWSIKYGKIYGAVASDVSVLEDLDKVLSKPLVHAKGVPLYIRAAAIDSGYATQTIYKFCKPRLRRTLPDGRSQFVFAIKGRSEYGRPVWPVASKTTRLRLSGRINLWTLGVDAAKDQVMARLGISEPGPGYCHFPLTREKDYFLGLTAEQSNMQRKAGVERRVWTLKKQGEPNEPFDCRVYGYAALVGLQAEPFLLNLDTECLNIESAQYLAPSAAVKSAPAPTRQRRRRSKGYEA